MVRNQIHMSDLKTIWDHLPSDELILDVRSSEEYAEGHVPGSLNIPYDLIQDHLNELEKYKKIYVYCKIGGRAQKASEALIQLGLSSQIVCVTESGMPDWISLGFSFVR